MCARMRRSSKQRVSAVQYPRLTRTMLTYHKLRSDSNRKRLQHFPRRQRRRITQTQRALRQRRAAGRCNPNPRPLSDVLHPHSRQTPTHRPLARKSPRRHQIPTRSHPRRQAGHLRLPRSTNGRISRHILR